MNRYTRQEVENIRIELQEAIDVVAAKYDSTINIGSISYSTNIKASITMSKMSENKHGKFAMTPQAQAFLQRSKRMGFRKDVLGETLMYKGDKIIIKGYNTRARKNPIQFSVNGKNYVAPEDYIKKVVFEVKPEWVL